MPNNVIEMPRLPRGIRNNNPGNIRAAVTYVWRGQSGSDDGGFAIFDSALWGLRAICIIWSNYRDLHGCSTLSDYVARWAPPSENDTTAYTDALARSLGAKPDSVIDIHADAVPLLSAIVMQENGQQPYSVTELQRAVTLSHER